jgi:hypothetical protein
MLWSSSHPADCGQSDSRICTLAGAEDGSTAAVLGTGVRSGSLAVCAAAAASLATFCDTLGRLCSGGGAAEGPGSKACAQLPPTGVVTAAASGDAAPAASIRPQLSRATWRRLVEGPALALCLWTALCNLQAAEATANQGACQAPCLQVQYCKV